MTISVLQDRQTSSSASVSSVALAFSSNVTAGSAAHGIGANFDSDPRTITFSDNNNNAWPAGTLDLKDDTVGQIRSFHQTTQNFNAGACTVTITFSAPNTAFTAIWIREIGGAASTGNPDGHNGVFSSSTASQNITATNASQPALISVVSINSNTLENPTLDASLTASSANPGWGWSGPAGTVAGHKRITSTGTQSITNTQATADALVTLMAIFVEGGGVAAAPFKPTDLDERVTTKVIASDFTAPNLLADKLLKLPPFIQKESPAQAPRALGVFTDFNAPNLLADQILKPPPFTQKELPGWALQAKGNYTDFAPPNLLADQVLKLPPFIQAELPGVMLRGRGITDFIHPNLIESTLLPTAPPLTPVDLSQHVKFRWAATDFNAPNLSFRLPVVTTPVTPQDFSLSFNARWCGSDFFTQNLLTGHLPAPPVAPIDATVSIRAKGVFTDFSPPNLALSTLIPPAALYPIETALLRLEYRWIRGDDLPLNLLPLRLQTVTPIAPQDLSGIRLDPRGLRSDFVPPNLTLTLPVPPPPPVSTGAGRHGTRRQARRRRELDVLRARIEAFKEQRADADRALMAAEDREVKARSQILKRIRVRTQELPKPIEQYAPVKKALAQRNVAADRYKSILGQIRAHQLEAERIQREIESEAADEEAALQLMHFLMMEIPWEE